MADFLPTITAKQLATETKPEPHRKILQNAGKVTTAIAKAFAESEFEKYRIIQDKFFESDFDYFILACSKSSIVIKKANGIKRFVCRKLLPSVA